MLPLQIWIESYGSKAGFSGKQMECYLRGVVWHLATHDHSVWFLGLKYFHNISDAPIVLAQCLKMSMLKSKLEVERAIQVQRDLIKSLPNMEAVLLSELAPQYSDEHDEKLDSIIAAEWKDSYENKVKLLQRIKNFDCLSLLQYIFQIRKIEPHEIASGFDYLKWFQDRATIGNKWQMDVRQRYSSVNPATETKVLNATAGQVVTLQDKLFLDIRRSLLGHVFLVWLLAQMHLSPKQQPIAIQRLVAQLLSPFYDHRIGLILASQPDGTRMSTYAALIFFVYTYINKNGTVTDMSDDILEDETMLMEIQGFIQEFATMLSIWEPDQSFWAQFVAAYLPVRDGNVEIKDAMSSVQVTSGDSSILQLVDVIEYQILFTLPNIQKTDWISQTRQFITVLRDSTKSQITLDLDIWCKYDADIKEKVCDKLMKHTKALLENPRDIATDVGQLQEFLKWWKLYELQVIELAYNLSQSEFVNRYFKEECKERGFCKNPEIQNKQMFQEWLIAFITSNNISSMDQNFIVSDAFKFARSDLFKTKSIKMKRFVTHQFHNPEACRNFLLLRNYCSPESRARKVLANRNALEKYPKQMDEFLTRVIDERSLFLPKAFVQQHTKDLSK
jgi:hypothetical protein